MFNIFPQKTKETLKNCQKLSYFIKEAHVLPNLVTLLFR